VTTVFGLFVAIFVSQTGSLFSADSWHNIAFAAGEVKNPERNVARAVVIGTILVITLYLPSECGVSGYASSGSHPASTRGPRWNGNTASNISPDRGSCDGSRSRGLDVWDHQRPNLDGRASLFCDGSAKTLLAVCGRLNAARVPAAALILQGVRASCLVLPRTYDPNTHIWGNLYSSLLEYVISAALLFYILTVGGVFRLRITRHDAYRPYRTP
jgi:APA family basic amino acid/polyamine antiporter